MSNSRFLVPVLMILVAVISRILPHPPNFAPLLAVSLFSGAYLMDKKLAYLVPLVAMIVSDLFIGLHDLLPVVYLTMAFVVFLGMRLREKPSMTATFGLTVLSSVLFFITTNLAVWLTSGMYPVNMTGLVACFTLAIPFFQNSIAGDLVYSGLLFGSMLILEKNNLLDKRPIAQKI